VNDEQQALDQFWMQRALELAAIAEQQGEVPIGAIVVKDDQIIGEGYNAPISQNDPSGHAEIRALRQAAATLGNYRLLNCSLYVTIEPCLMCVGALVHARIKELVYGATEPKTGAVCSAFSVLDAPSHNHQIEVRHGVLAEECATKLREFFQQRRRAVNKSANPGYEI
jgi:tRNA(adenine34) deaminase